MSFVVTDWSMAEIELMGFIPLELITFGLAESMVRNVFVCDIDAKCLVLVFLLLLNNFNGL
jgi:hypothetical protein